MPTLALRVPPAVVVVIAALLIWRIPQALPSLVFPFPGRVWIARVCAVVGLLIVIAGLVAFRRARTTVNPLTPESTTTVVSSGVYRFSRNPMYLGFLLLLAGWALYWANPVALLVLPAYVVYMNRFQIVPEEQALAARFGETYLAYKRSVRRWL